MKSWRETRDINALRRDLPFFSDYVKNYEEKTVFEFLDTFVRRADNSHSVSLGGLLAGYRIWADSNEDPKVSGEDFVRIAPRYFREQPDPTGEWRGYRCIVEEWSEYLKES